MPRTRSLNNLDSVGDLLGSLAGIADGLDQDRYLEDIIKDAHKETSKRFDLAAAARASTSRNVLHHVYEFGVVGITRGPIRFPDPTAPEARLWKHTITGQGGQQNIGYTFRPATQRNPQPTTRATGVPSVYLKKLSQRKYIFYNKAFVMETGQTVSIKSDRGDRGLIFVPTPGENEPRNYIMYPTRQKGPLQIVPGKKTSGTFTAFWLAWWSKAGSESMEMEMRGSITADIKQAEKDAEKRARAIPMRPASSNKPIAAARKAQSRAKKLFGRRIR